MPAAAQVKDSTSKSPGHLWGLVFGDYYYKAAADSAGRGGANQYSGIEKGRNAFQIRRAYLGYRYDISKDFTAELLLAAEDNVSKSGGSTGDLLNDGKLTYYIKWMNLRWKNIWRGTDLVVGEQPTPGFVFIEEPAWRYRFIERTITDIRRTPSFDLGVGLQGKFDPDENNFGYNFLVGNGTSAKPENDRFKWFYADVFAKLFDKKLTLTLYADYNRLNWTKQFHHSRTMIKFYAGYSIEKISIGVEGFRNTGKNDVVGIRDPEADTLTAHATGVSTFVRGSIIKDKLGYFARIDIYNPDVDYDNGKFTSYNGLSAAYEPNNKEMFITAGLDFTPVRNVHFSPNVWWSRYQAQQAGLKGNAKLGHDLVYRATFYYAFGK